MSGAGKAPARARVRALGLLAVLAVLAGAAGPALPAQGGSVPVQQAKAGAAADEALASRQLLVMLRMPPPHFRAGADYGGGYGSGAGSDPGRPARRRAAQDLAREHGLRVVDDWPMPVIGVDCFVMEGPAGTGAAQLSALARDPRVAWAQPVKLFHGMEQGGPAADPLYPLQPDGKAWHLAELHRVSTGRGVRVAVVDSGVDGRHPDLAGQLALRENFVDEGEPPAEAHGTAVAGVIAARAGNGLGIVGVAPGARLMALRACWENPGQPGGNNTRCSSFTLGKALNFAILHDAQIINLSLGGPADRLLETLVHTATVRGATVVGAVDPARQDGFPASAPGVLAVGTEGIAPGMAAPGGAAIPGAQETMNAPGTDIPSCLPGARWGFVSGTSYAAAHVSGLAALLAQLLAHAGPGGLRSHMVTRPSSATLERTANRGAAAASGVTIDACASIARAAGTCVCSCHPQETLKTSRIP
jgi:hypothetical protein